MTIHEGYRKTQESRQPEKKSTPAMIAEEIRSVKEILNCKKNTVPRVCDRTG